MEQTKHITSCNNNDDSCTYNITCVFIEQKYDLPWGSIMSGHRRDFSTMIPFSMENASTGRPAMFHARTTTGSPSVAASENDSEQGISDI